MMSCRAGAARALCNSNVISSVPDYQWQDQQGFRTPSKINENQRISYLQSLKTKAITKHLLFLVTNEKMLPNLARTPDYVHNPVVWKNKIADFSLNEESGTFRIAKLLSQDSSPENLELW